METDVRNQNSSSIMAKGILFLKNNFEECWQYDWVKKQKLLLKIPIFIQMNYKYCRYLNYLQNEPMMSKHS